jgi:hypothetical protein
MKSESYKITPEKTGESLRNFEVKADDLYICDRAYGKPASMNYCRENGGNFIFRIKKDAFNIYSSKRTKINLIVKLKNLKDGEHLDYNCYYKNEKNEYTPIRICAMKKPKNLKDTDGVNGDTAFMNNYIVVVTSIKKSEASAGEILEAYRIRWQVELYFKRLKSLLSFGDIPTKTPENTETWLHGKLVAAILLEIEAASVDFSPLNEEAGRRSIWREMKFLSLILKYGILSLEEVIKNFIDISRFLFVEKRRKPDRVLQLSDLSLS